MNIPDTTNRDDAMASNRRPMRGDVRAEALLSGGTLDAVKAVDTFS